MLERCRQLQLSLNIKKCIFDTPIGILIENLVCKEGINVDLAKIKSILDLKPHVNPKKVRPFLGHTGYYRKFIRNYSDITYPMEVLLKINVPFIWNQECIEAFETLKKILVEAPILRFPNWSKKFHVHIDASTIVVSAILTQPRDENLDHPNGYGSWKLNNTGRNYLMTEQEGLEMIFALHKFPPLSFSFMLIYAT